MVTLVFAVNIQIFRGRIRDGDWQRGHQSEIMHDGKENYQLCGQNNFLGLSNGHLVCDKNEEEKEEKEVLPYGNVENFANY